jgi:hypothetical protein
MSAHSTDNATRRVRGAVLVAAAVAVAGITLARSAAAQRAGAKAGCGVDTTAAWYRSQKAFYTDAHETWSDDTLRAVLLRGAGYDPRSAFVPELGFRLDTRGEGSVRDTAALATLRAMAARRQWPTRSVVGAAGVHAAWLIAQSDSALAVAAMHRMMEAGPGESSPAEVAVLEDMRRVQVGRGQIHGTQFRREGGGVTLAGRLEDSTHVDMRREGAWLPPLAVSACLAREAAR